MMNLETIRQVRSRLAESQLSSKIYEAQGKAKRSLRKVVTGNPDKKVRDYMKETPQVTIIMMFDIIMIIFTFIVVPDKVG